MLTQVKRLRKRPYNVGLFQRSVTSFQHPLFNRPFEYQTLTYNLNATVNALYSYSTCIEHVWHREDKNNGINRE